MPFGFSRNFVNYGEEAQGEALKAKWLLIAGVAFLVSTYYSYREFKYLAWGQHVDATVTRMYEHSKPGRRRSKTVQVVEYEFTDSGNRIRNERDSVPLSWQIAGPLVAVQYLPGEAKSSRLKGNSNKVAVWIFLGCVGWLGYSFVQLYREANAPIARRPRSPRPVRRQDF